MTIREALVIFVIIGLIPCGVHAQDKATGKPTVFEKANMLVVEGGKVDQILDKRNQKVILPAFEVKSGVKVEAVGENK